MRLAFADDKIVMYLVEYQFVRRTGLRFLEALQREVAYADGAGETVFNDGVHAAHRVFQRHIWIDLMDKKQVHVVCFQSLKRIFRRLEDIVCMEMRFPDF